MAEMTEICAVLKNYYLKDYVNYTDIHKGTFTISGHSFAPLDFEIKTGQYFRIKNSDLNDGVWLNTNKGLEELADEVFTGEIWLMSVPKHFAALCDEINAWKAKYESIGSANMSPFTSENVQGVYSYSKGSGGSQSGGSYAWTWQDVFKRQLNAYRRMSEL